VNWCVLGIFILASNGPVCAVGADAVSPRAPEVLSLFPFGGQGGTSLETEILGTDLDGAYALLFGDAAIKGTILKIEAVRSNNLQGTESDLETVEGKKPSQLERALARFIIPGDATSGLHSLRMVSPRGLSNAVQFYVNSEPLVLETDKSHTTPSQAQLIRLPCALSGKISKQGEVDYYAFDASRNQPLSFKIVSNKVGKEDKRDVAELTLYDRTGSWFDPQRATRLAFSNTTRLTYRFSKPGRYLLGVGSFLGIGGIDLVYQLQVLQTDGLPNAGHLIAESGSAGWQERAWDRPLVPSRLTVLASRTTPGARPQHEVSIASGSQKPSGDVDDLAGGQARAFRPVSVVHKSEGETAPGQSAGLRLPALLEGTIAYPGKVDTYKFHAHAGERLAFEIETPNAGPPQFNPRLGLFDSSGSELCSNIFRYAGGASADYLKTLEPKTIFNFERDGEYSLQIRDITSRYGDPQFAYRILIRPQVPHIGKVEIGADRINLIAGQAAELGLTSELEEGFAGGVAFTVENLPPGVQAVPGAEVEPEHVPLPDEGRKERYRPKSQRATVMLLARANAPLTRMPHIIRIIANPVANGLIGAPLPVGEFPLMVIAPDEQKVNVSQARRD
jgi:hypothetical protein